MDADSATADARSAIEAFMEAMREAQVMAAGGRVRTELDELLLHAKELLDIVDEALLNLDPEEFRAAHLAAPVLRAKLETLRDELRSGAAH